VFWTAWIEAAQPIDLAPIYRKFVVNEKAELAKIDQQVRAAIFHLIQNMQTTKSYQKQEIEAKPHLS
jgi:hypothetical protein